ncbi:methionine sulfoxide reductase [Bifidobacterium pseudolongum subsp. pseudolongum]|uniref:hypothetical protein n=1 Tax=Bifidobacterium pseudolongum TaxID=1694 RepID=UPI000CA9B50B|nr:hypothetical protein [Bifidobacterium pseudolongum]PKV07281.1 methionine sulfoxide reductase [Bifidobacterium pseudolongum subsp. pseudolongum]
MKNVSAWKSINLFLMDGDATGRIKCTLANWTGIAYKIPRTSLDLCKGRDDLKQSGVYSLFGTSDKTGRGAYTSLRQKDMDTVTSMLLGCFIQPDMMVLPSCLQQSSLRKKGHLKASI